MEFFHYPFNSSSLVGSGEDSKFYKSFSQRKDACPSFFFLPEFQFRFSDAGAGAAAGSAAALKVPFCEVFQHSVAATVGEDKLARAAPVGAATDLLDVEAAVQEVAPNFDGLGDTSGLHSIVSGNNGACGIAATDLHAASNSEGMGNAAELHGKLNSKVAFGNVNILGDLGSIAFSVTREAVIRGSHSNSLHCHLIHVHAPLLASFSDCVCGECCGSVCARVGAGGGDDVGMDACVDEKVGSNSLIQGSGCRAKACACLDALQNSRRVRGHCLRGGTKCSSTGSGAQVWLSDGIKVSLSHQK